MINIDGRVNNERPPSQNGDVDWPLGHMANNDNTEHRNHKQKGDSGPAQAVPLTRAYRLSRRGLHAVYRTSLS